MIAAFMSRARERQRSLSTSRPPSLPPPAPPPLWSLPFILFLPVVVPFWTDRIETVVGIVRGGRCLGTAPGARRASNAERRRRSTRRRHAALP